MRLLEGPATRYPGQLRACVLVVVACAGLVTGCSSEERPSAAVSTPAFPARTATPATTTSPTRDPSAGICELVGTAAYSQLFAEALAIGREPSSGQAFRSGIAATYGTFAEKLTRLAASADGALATALTNWATATAEVSRYVSGHKPGHGNVVEYGPGQARAASAQKAAEAVCGHPLPDLHQ